MNPLFEELLAQAPGQTPVMPVAPTVASTGGTVAQPLTPAGHALAGGILHGLMFPGKAALGEAQVFDPEGHTTDEAVNWGVDRALGMVGKSMIPKTPVAPNELAFGSGPIRAYHGSPHDFERFDLSKIGTGEGAQAYGHGLYFAENPQTAQAYRDALAGERVLANGVPITDDIGRDIATHVLGFKSTPEAYADVMRSRLAKFADRPNDPMADFYRQNLARAEELKGAKFESAPAGRMYEVAIHADPERLLNLDRPVAQQGQIHDILQSLPEYRAGVEQSARIGMPRINEDGLSAYDTISLGAKHMGRVPEGTRPDRVASQVLNEAGIPGIKYLDQGSRTAGDGSRNFVTFSDKIVEIMRKYGVASFAALPPAVQMMLQRGQTETPASNGGLGGLGGLAPRA